MKKNDRSDDRRDRKEEIIVSACLLGVKCRYDGGSKPSPLVGEYLRDYTVVPVCPETFGGLERPRPAAELDGCTGPDILKGRGRVVDRNGVNVTAKFIDGARRTLDAARKCGARRAILKSRSPSCGTRFIYDGTFSGETRDGMGVAAALLAENGIELISEDDLDDSGKTRDGKGGMKSMGGETRNDRQALKAIILKNSMKFGDFTLSSGRKSDFYIDARLTTLDPTGAVLIGRLLYDRIRELDLRPDAIGGMTMGADPISMAVALRSLEKGEPIQAIVVRKSQKGHGTKRRIEGNFKPGDRVVVVEDVGTTGGSALEAIEVIRGEGGEVVQVFLIVDRMMGALEKLGAEGVSVEALFQIDEIIEGR